MKKQRKVFGVMAAIIFIAMVMAGCGGSGGGTSVVSSATGVSDGATGGLSVQLIWQTPDGKFAAPAGVATVRLSISASDMATTTRDFAASANSGTLSAILAGTSRTVSAKGLDSAGGCLYSGSTSGVTVTAGQTTSVTVTMSTPCAASGLVAYWKFDEGSGTTAADSSGYGNNGTVYGGATWTTGKVGGALQFDGVDDYVDVPNNGKTNFEVSTDSYTVEMWVKFLTLPTNDDATLIIDRQVTNSPTPTSFYINYRSIDPATGNNYAFMVQAWNGSLGTLPAFSTTHPLTNIWYHVASVFDTKEIKIYVNGTLEATSPIQISGTKNQVGLTMGMPDCCGHYFFNGLLDEMKIYNYARSASEITQDASVTASSNKIVFISSRDGNREVYSMNTDGTNVTRLTNDTIPDLDPHISPDGTKIIWVKGNNGAGEIYKMNSDGTGQTKVSINAVNDYYPAYSPDMSKITFTSWRDGGHAVYTMSPDGTNVVKLVSGGHHSVFSPNGTKIAYSSSSGSGVYIMNSDGTNVQLINSTGDDPQFSPDGSKILYSVGNVEVWVMNVDGTNQTRLSTNGSGAEFSADGTKIVFQSNRDGNDEIYIMNVDGTNQTRLTNNSAEDIVPSF